ncbi:MAG: ABC transporter permease subunit [Planctomycetales bacterium]|nr:ABC transporter permease subunit [Planctomycetales bacterium]
MNKAFLLKTIRDARLLLIACTATLFAFSWIRIFIVASMEVGRFQKITRNLPDVIKRLSPVPINELVSYPGLVGITFEEPVAYLIMAAWAIARASDVISGEIGRGSMEMLLAQPISRAKYLFGHSLVTVCGIAIIAGAAYGGTHVGITNAKVEAGPNRLKWRVPVFGFDVTTNKKAEPRFEPMTKYVQPKVFQAATLNYFCFGFFLCGITTAVSSLSRFRWQTIGLVVAFYVVQTVIELWGLAAEGWRWALNFTFFSAYEPIAFSVKISEDASYAWKFFKPDSFGMLPDLGPLGCDAALLIQGLCGFLFASFWFNRRDLPAPL